MSINKADSHARACWGEAYDNIPKSVFATVAWHLASVSGDSPGAFLEQLRALADNGTLPERQANACAKALAALTN